MTASTPHVPVPAAPPRGARRWLRRRLPALLGLIAALILGVLAAGAIAKGTLQARFPPAGRLVDIGGYRLHIACQGAGPGPTVVLDAGSGENSLTWALVQPEVARFARVCAYDRGGIGWSDASPRPRRAAVMVGELRALLGRAGLPGPFVLVGHSTGGLIARQYAARYPGEVSGLVLVDSAHEAQFRRFSGPIVRSSVRALQQLRSFEPLIALGIPALIPGLAPLEPRLPAPIAEAARALTVSNPKQVAAARGEIEDLMRGATRPVTTLGDLPLVVVSRGHADAGTVDASVPPALVAQHERLWTRLQLELAALSSRGRRVVATASGHSVQLDAPQAVVSAIREVWTARR